MLRGVCWSHLDRFAFYTFTLVEESMLLDLPFSSQSVPSCVDVVSLKLKLASSRMVIALALSC